MDGLCPASEDLTVGDRHGVLKMRPTRLHHVSLAGGQTPKGRLEPRALGEQRVSQVEGHESDGRRRHVVGGLAEVHVIVGMDRRVSSAAPAQMLIGEVRDDFVHVHVHRCASAGVQAVEDIHVGNAAGGDAIGGDLDRTSPRPRQDAEGRVGARRRLLDEGVGADQGRMGRSAGEVEGFARALREDAVERARRDGLHAEAVMLSAHRPT